MVGLSDRRPPFASDVPAPFLKTASDLLSVTYNVKEKKTPKGKFQAKKGFRAITAPVDRDLCKVSNNLALPIQQPILFQLVLKGAAADAQGFGGFLAVAGNVS